MFRVYMNVNNFVKYTTKRSINLIYIREFIYKKQ